MKRVIYTYITTNIVNKKQYVGSHATEDVDDGYLGSGKMLINAIRKYGKVNFKREIVEYYPNREQAYIAEGELIKIHKTLKPNGYNISPIGGFFIPGYESHWRGVNGKNAPRYGVVASNETRMRISRARKRVKYKGVKRSLIETVNSGYPVLQFNHGS